MIVLSVLCAVFLLPIIVNPFLITIEFAISKRKDWIKKHNGNKPTVGDIFEYHQDGIEYMWMFPFLSLLTMIYFILSILVFHPIHYCVKHVNWDKIFNKIKSIKV